MVFDEADFLACASLRRSASLFGLIKMLRNRNGYLGQKSPKSVKKTDKLCQILNTSVTG